MITEEIDKKTLGKILRSKVKLEKKLNVTIKVNKSQLSFEGDEVDIYLAEKVIDAIAKKFPIEVALLLTSEDYILEEISIKSITKRRDLNRIKSRLIGTGGKTIDLLGELSDCYITLKNNMINIIGPADAIKDAVNAIKSLVKGSKQSNVYSYLERIRKKFIPPSLGLRKKE